MESLFQALISGLAIGSAYALVALGFSVTFTTTKTLNFLSCPPFFVFQGSMVSIET
jgi:branched-subunit amino acid ABC-type transport system permease component